MNRAQQRLLLSSAVVNARKLLCQPPHLVLAARSAIMARMGQLLALSAASAAAAAMVAVATAATAPSQNMSSRSSSTLLEEKGASAASDKNKKELFQINVDFMDKLAMKPYMTTTTTTTTTSSRTGGDNTDEAHQAAVAAAGVPRTLRLLTVDVPEVALSGFQGGRCVRASDKVYPDGVAAPLRKKKQQRVGMMPVHGGHRSSSITTSSSSSSSSDGLLLRREGGGGRRRNQIHSSVELSASKSNNAEEQLVEIEQKAWVHSMYRCYHDNKVGVEIMQASTANLNPRRLKREHALLRTYVTLRNQQEQQEVDASVTATNSATKRAAMTTTKVVAIDNKQSENDALQQSISSLEDELEAPWNQHAWASELQLRISGRVEFGAALEPVANTARLSSLLPTFFKSSSSSNNNHAHCYKSTVPSRVTFFDWLLSPIYYVTWYPQRTDPAGRDGCCTCTSQPSSCYYCGWAQHKPHAVIADGAALQRVPAAHRLLQKACHEHNVPLYVIRDPRAAAYRGTASSSSSASLHHHPQQQQQQQAELPDVLRHLHTTVKSRIVQAHLQQAAGTSFQRGRWMGKLESDVKWQAASAVQKAEDALKRAKETKRRRQELDWKHLDEAALEQKLIKAGVMIRKKGMWSTGAESYYTDAFKSLAKRYIDSEAKPEIQDAVPASTENESSTTPVVDATEG